MKRFWPDKVSHLLLCPGSHHLARVSFTVTMTKPAQQQTATTICRNNNSNNLLPLTCCYGATVYWWATLWLLTDLNSSSVVCDWPELFLCGVWLTWTLRWRICLGLWTAGWTSCRSWWLCCLPPTCWRDKHSPKQHIVFVTFHPTGVSRQAVTSLVYWSEYLSWYWWGYWWVYWPGYWSVYWWVIPDLLARTDAAVDFTDDSSTQHLKENHSSSRIQNLQKKINQLI